MRPGNGSKAFFRLFGLELIKPHMRVDINYFVRKEILQVLLVEITVNRFDFE